MKRSIPNLSMYDAPWSTTEFNGMPYRRLGNSGLWVSNVGLGTWKFGYPETGDGARVDARNAFQIFDKAVDLGVTFWDTANRYNAASGNSERLIGDWLSVNPRQRRNIVIATKLFGGMDGTTPNHSRLSRTNILESVYSSLDRLGSDWIDLLYFHAYDYETDIEESLLAVEDLIRQDVVRYFAVSNFTVENLLAYEKKSQCLSKRTKITAVQNRYDVIDRESTEAPGVLEYCKEANISFIAYSPLARGLLTSRYLDKNKKGKGDRLFDEQAVENLCSPERMAVVQNLNKLAQRFDMDISQLVLAYMLTIPGMGPVIPASSNVDQLQSNALSGKLQLSEEVLKAISSVVQSPKMA